MGVTAKPFLNCMFYSLLILIQVEMHNVTKLSIY